MSTTKPTYEELEQRCRNAEAMLQAIRSGQADTVLGEHGMLVLRLAEAEKKADHIKRVLQAIRRVNQLIVKEQDPGTLMEDVCSNLTNTRGYESAWVALLDEAQREVIMSASSGFDDEYHLLKDRLQRGDFPECMNRALQADETVVIRDPVNDCSDCPAIHEHGGRSTLARRLAFGDHKYGVLVVSVPADFAEDEEEQNLFEELVGDLSFTLDRLRTTSRLEESEKRFTSAYENSGVGMGLVTVDGRFISVNPAVTRILGFSADEMLDLAYTDITDPRDLELSVSYVNKLVAGHLDQCQFDKRYVHKDGRTVWGRINISMVRDSTGRPLYIVYQINDITAQKMAEEERDRILNMSQDLICVASINGYFTYLNPAWEEALGYSREYLLSKPFLEFIHPEDHQKNDEEVEKLASGIASVDFENRYICKDGSVITVNWLATPLPKEGLLYCIGRDVTARRKVERELQASERKYRDLYENSPEILLSIEAESGKITECNETCVRVMGYRKEDLVGRYVSEMYDPDYAAQAESSLTLFRKTGEIRDVEMRVKCRDGSTRDVILNAKAVRNEQDKILRSRSSWRDVTELRHVEQELRREKERAETYLDIAGVMFIALDENGQITLANRMASEILGMASADIIGKNWLETFVPERFRQQVRSVYRQLMAGEIEPVEYHENPVLTGKGEERLIWWHNSVLTDKDGNITEIIASGLDITERNAAEEALRESEQRFKCMFEKHSAVMLLIEPETGGILDANVAATRYYGYDKKQLQQMAIHEINTLPQDRIAKERLRALNEECNYFIFPHRLEAGHVRTVEVLSSPIETQDQRLLFSIIHDITDRKMAEEALKSSEERFRSTFDQAAVGMAHVALDGRWLRVNRKLCDIVGYSAEELKRLTFQDISHPDDLEAHRDKVRQLLEGAIENYCIEKRYIRKDGSEVWINLTVALVRHSSGEPNYFISVIQDISQRKKTEAMLRESEERYRVVVENLRIGISVINKERQILAVNPFFQEIYPEVRPGEGQLCHEMYNDPPSATPCDYCPCTLSFQDGQVHECETETPLGNEIRNFRIISCPVKNEQGEVDLIIELVDDITERKSLRAQLTQAQRMESIATLAGGVAHDFNNLLTVILGYSELVLVGKDAQHQDFKGLQAIVDAADRGAELVKQILTFSRGVESHPRPMNLNNQVQQIQRLLYKTIPKMIDIELQLTDDLPNIEADPTQIEQILLNLAVNAKDAMPDGGTLVFRTQEVFLDEAYCRFNPGSKAGRHIILQVSDTGCGMDADIKDHIFEPFFSTKKPGEGTGLGLAMVFGIVKKHGGHITCQSRPGTGTTFKLYFPAIDFMGKADFATAAELPALGTETILLVDDEELIRDLGAKILRKGGYEVLTARSGQEALELYRENMSSVNLVILDLIMPEMGGKKCLEELVKIDPGVRVVIGSGYAVDDETREFLRAHSRGTIGKPYKINEMLTEVRRVLDST